MKKTETRLSPRDFPERLSHLIAGKIYDSSSSPEARVFYLSEHGSYLKCAAAGALENEAKMTEYFHTKGLSSAVLDYFSEGGYDWLLTERIDGEDATHASLLQDGKRLAATIGELLRSLHECDTAGCPVKDRNSDYLRTVREGYRIGRFDASFFGTSGDKDTIFSEFEKRSELLSGRVLLHGDFCLPNIILRGYDLSGYIDLGAGGIGDRHIDLFWGAWTLNFNLGTDKYRDVFFDAYGRELINPEAIKMISAAECFG